MIIFERFLGRRAELPEDRRYSVRQGLWAKQDDHHVTVGLSEPALILAGGLKSVEWLVNEGQSVEQEETVIFAITREILYIDAPLSGRIHFNPSVKNGPEFIMQHPYDGGWLFRLIGNERTDVDFQRLAGAWTYAEILKSSDGCKNPKGLKGGGPGVREAIYNGIGEQKS